jgi:hypothetical protein
MAAPRAGTAPANRLAADVLSDDLLVNLHPHLDHKVDRARVVEIRDLRF